MALNPVDLLVFGPHPDDLEIGLGGTIAKHVANGNQVVQMKYEKIEFNVPLDDAIFKMPK